MTSRESSPMEAKVRAYRAGCVHYLENSLRFLSLHEYAKASEFAWGAMAQAVKAVAASGGIELRQHRELWDSARELSRELDDATIFRDFQRANALHSNFYEAGLLPEEVSESLEDIRATVGKLLGLLPEEANHS